MTLNPLFPSAGTLGIHTDLYELTMAAAYFQAGCQKQRACFELFTRRLPPQRSFLMAAGLEQALHLVEQLRFEEATLDYLKSLDIFGSVDPSFFNYLREFRFTGDVHALPEGTLVFENEPILRVTAPVIEAQILETYLITTINYQTMVASKAARIWLAAEGRGVVDFGSRRAHGPQAGVLAARAAFIGGCSGTSNVLAGYEMGIPTYGTMAHSFIQFFGREEEAFRLFWQSFPEASVLLIDTYDTLKGAEKAIQLGEPISGVRLDSGDLLELSIRVRRMLDVAGRQNVQIFASGDLEEQKIRSLRLAGAPIDAFGVGTQLVVSADAPSCDMIYKLVAADHGDGLRPRTKASPGKNILPYPKQIYRRVQGGRYVGDWVDRWDEPPPKHEDSMPLLQPHVQAGHRVVEPPALTEIQSRGKEQLSRLSPSIKFLHTPHRYPVDFSPSLQVSPPSTA